MVLVYLFLSSFYASYNIYIYMHLQAGCTHEDILPNNGLHNYRVFPRVLRAV